DGVRVVDESERGEAFDELGERRAQRGRPERHDDVIAREQLVKLHRTPLVRVQSTARMRPTTSDGLRATPMPLSSNAWIFSAAVPADPLMIAPAWPMRRPGGAVCPAMKPTTGLLMRSFT